MAGTFTTVNLSALPAPDVIEALDFESILAAMLAELRMRDSAFSALVESDPAYKILEVAAWRELLLRQRVNDACRAVLLSSAAGADLDQIGANLGVERLLVAPADDAAVPPVAAVYEADDDFRARIQLSFEGYSTAGPAGAYVYHALSADGRVRDVGVTSPTPGHVLVTVLAREGDGTAPADVLAAVEAALNDEDVRPLCDTVTVRSAQIVPFAVAATLELSAGPDSAVVVQSARDALEQYLEGAQRVGRDVTLSGLYAALQQAGVQNVVLTQPAASVAVSPTQAAYCTGITIATTRSADA